MVSPAIITRRNSFGHPIFKNDVVQGISILSGLILTIGTIWYFHHEVKNAKMEREKNNLEIKKLKEEIAELTRKRNDRRGA